MVSKGGLYLKPLLHSLRRSTDGFGYSDGFKCIGMTVEMAAEMTAESILCGSIEGDLLLTLRVGEWVHQHDGRVETCRHSADHACFIRYGRASSRWVCLRSRKFIERSLFRVSLYEDRCKLFSMNPLCESWLEDTVKCQGALVSEFRP